MALLGPPLSDKYTQTYFFSSDPANEALNVSSDGSKFSVQLSAPISVPAGARACEAGVITAAIWNTTPTVGPGLGPAGVDDNKFSNTTSAVPAGTYNITFPTGQYSLTAIGQYLSSQFTNNGHAANLMSLGGQEATGLAFVSILNIGDAAHFGQVGSIGSILGFPAATVTATSAGQVLYGSTQAQLDRVNTYLISTDLIQGGIPTNATATGLIAAVPINVRPGSLINYQAIIPLWTPAPELIGNTRRTFSFRLTNERGEATPTANESWSFTLMIRYRK